MNSDDPVSTAPQHSLEVVTLPVHDLDKSGSVHEAVGRSFERYGNVAGVVYLTGAARADAASGLVRGHVTRLDGSALIDSLPSPLVSERTGRGVTWLPLEPESIDEARVRTALKDDTFGLQRRAPGASAYVLRHQRDFDAEAVLVVHGANAEASRALVGRVRAAIAAGAPLTLHEVATSAEYAKAVETGRATRASLAADLAEHLGVTVRAAPVDDVDAVTRGDAPTHALVPAPHSSAAAPRYDVFDGAFDTRTAHAGVLVFASPLAGASLYRAPRRASGTGKVTRAWTPAARGQPPVFASSAEVLSAASTVARRRAISARTSAALRAQAEARLHSHGVATGYNPRLEREYVALDDEHALASAAIGAGDVDVERIDFKLVAGELPGVDSTDMTLAQLAHVATATSARELPVRVGGEAWRALALQWPRLRATQSKYTRFADVVANESPSDGTVRVDTDLLAAVARLEAAAT